jgi:pyruvate kinase
VPVIWAMQILEGMAKKGAPSRAEISNAVMSSRAECAMLNEGPFIVETVHFLSGILTRMDSHLHKRRALLRRLSISELRLTRLTLARGRCLRASQASRPGRTATAHPERRSWWRIPASVRRHRSAPDGSCG